MVKQKQKNQEDQISSYLNYYFHAVIEAQLECIHQYSRVAIKSMKRSGWLCRDVHEAINVIKISWGNRNNALLIKEWNITSGIKICKLR